ncbi:MAG: PQQ-dependent sugar dehydrogenase [Verrucomicrobiota bacterium]
MLNKWLCSISLSLVVSTAFGAKVGELYDQHCKICHGADLKGGIGASLVDGQWRGDGSREFLTKVLKKGQPELGMPGFEGVLSDAEIRALVIFIREKEKAALAAPPPKPEESTGVFNVAGEKFRVETVASGFKIPWGVDFLPDGRYIVTERPGTVRIVEADGTVNKPIVGTPEVFAKGQGGMLEVAVDPDYASNGWIYLGFSDKQKRKGEEVGLTKVVRGKVEGNEWREEETLFEAPEKFYSPTGQHFGTQIVFDGEGHLFFSIGDRGRQNEAQDINRPNGKIHRINTDGSIPMDNPFRDDGFPTVWSYGNRNAQGLAMHPVTNELWESEHGPRGGDEINLIERGKNYGWPVITYGMNYNGTPITSETERPGMEQPKHYWTPSIAVSGIDFYQGYAFSSWKNHLLVGSLRQEELHLLEIEDGEVKSDTIVLEDHGRIRDVVSGPDGAIYLVVNSPDQLIRIVPAD